MKRFEQFYPQDHISQFIFVLLTADKNHQLLTGRIAFQIGTEYFEI